MYIYIYIFNIINVDNNKNNIYTHNIIFYFINVHYNNINV